jgi:hypothetical protein
VSEATLVAQAPDGDERPGGESALAAADPDAPGAAGSPFAAIVNSLMAAMTLGAVASLAMALGRILR